MSYTLLKTLHVTTVVISRILFLWRWIYVLRYEPASRPRWMRWLPHLNDTLLLILGLGLVWQTQQYPFVAGWLTAKLTALLLYIFLGLYVMRFASGPLARFYGGISALTVFGYMVGVAVTRNSTWLVDLFPF